MRSLLVVVVSVVVAALVFVATSISAQAAESKSFNAPLDFYRQISSVLNFRQFESLKQLLAENAETSKSALEPLVERWANASDLAVGAATTISAICETIGGLFIGGLSDFCRNSACISSKCGTRGCGRRRKADDDDKRRSHVADYLAACCTFFVAFS